MDPISLVPSILSLAGLYSTCVQGMGQIDTGSTDLGDGSRRIFTTFEAERFLLKKWGKRVGIKEDDDGSVGAEGYDPALDNDENRSLLYNILANIEDIWDDGDRLSGIYGLEPTAQITDNATLQNAKLGVKKPGAKTEERTFFSRKCIWCVKEEDKFLLLVAETGAFIEKLYSIITIEGGKGQLAAEVVGKLDEMKLYLDDGARERIKEMVEQRRFQCGVKQYLNSEKRKQPLEWISTAPITGEGDRALADRQETPWILGEGDFLGWQGPILSTETSNVIWIHGKPGTERPILSTVIIDSLKKNSSFPVAYFLCPNEETVKNDPAPILRSWIIQLANERIGALEVIGKLKKEHGFAEYWLWRILSEILDRVACYLVVDGFDKCLDYDTTSWPCQMRVMENFFRNLCWFTKSRRGKVLIISRNDPSIGSTSTKSNPLSNPLSEPATSPEGITQDIQLFSHGNLDSINIEGKETRSGIFDRPSNSRQGIFLWAWPEGERLELGITATELQDTLSLIPRSLELEYRDSLKRIASLSSEKQDLARNIFQWVLFAARPLSVQELFHALATKDDGSPIQSANIPGPIDIDRDFIQSQILQLCGSFIETRPSTSHPNSVSKSTIHFVHFSAKRYLLDSQDECGRLGLEGFSFTTPGESHDILTRSCLSYLLSTSPIPEGITPTFAAYSARYWTIHFRLSTPNGRSRCIDMQRKLLSPGPALDTWTKMGVNKFMTLTPLEAASWHGLLDIFKEILISPDTNPNESTTYGTPLAIASQEGHEELVEHLLTIDGVDVNRTDNEGETPLFTAVTCREEAIVQRLLAREDVDVNLPNKDGWTPIFKAAHRGYEAIVRHLLTRKDLDVNVVENDGWTPLYAAVYGGYDGVVKELLARAGTDVNPVNSEGHTPLFRAARGGHRTIVQQLLAEKNIDVNLPSLNGKTPLSKAARNGHEAVVKQLLARTDIDVNFADKSGKTPLFRAVEKGQKEVVQYLLARKDVDVNYADNEGSTPLHVAEQSGNEEIVAELLKKISLKDASRA